jgi:hypothetical protein
MADGSSWFRIGLHVPTVVARAQLWQGPLQATSQHTPSTQLLLVHSTPDAHAVPFVFFTRQTLFGSQYRPAAQG